MIKWFKKEGLKMQITYVAMKAFIINEENDTIF